MNPVRDYYQNGPYANYVKQFSAAGKSQVSVIHLSQPAGEFPDPPTPAFCLFMVAGGVVKTKIDFGDGPFSRTQRPGSFVLAPANTRCDYQVDGPHELIAISMPTGSVLTQLEELSTGSPAVFGRLHEDTFRHPYVELLCHQLLQEVTEGNPQGDLFADYTLMMLVRILSSMDVGGSRSNGGERMPSISAPRLRRVINYMRDRVSEKVSLNELAAVAGVTKYHFARQFMSAMGISPHQFMIVQRIEHAKQRIIAGRENLTQIALSVGFADQSHFGRFFKRHTGMTPGQFANSPHRSN